MSILMCLKLGFSVLLLFLNCWSDAPPTKLETLLKKSQRPSPELRASFLNSLYFGWFTNIIWQGFRKPLTENDLYDVNPDLSSRGIIPRFDRHFEKTLKKANMGSQKKQEQISTFSKQTETVDISKNIKEKSTKKISILPSLIKTLGGPFAVSIFLRFGNDSLGLAIPQIVKLIINSFGESKINSSLDSNTTIYEDNDIGEHEVEDWKGFFYAGAMLVVSMVQLFCFSQYFLRIQIAGMNVRTILVSAIYRKSIKMAPTAKKDSTVGQMVNLMSVDSQRIIDMTWQVNLMWSAPLQICFAMYFIYQELGNAAFAALTVMILMLPLNFVIGFFTRKFQRRVMKFKDIRIKLMNEVLGGIKVLKLNAWEPSFITKILMIRAKETKVLRKAAFINAFSSFIWTSAPMVVALSTFTTYVLINGGQILSAQKAFVSIMYLNIMRMPMSFLPMIINNCVQATVSLNRINKFLNNQELDENAVQHEGDSRNAIIVKNGTFRWGEEEKPVIRNVSFNIPKGSLTAIVGTVGSGKSSMLSAILGELDKVSGSVNLTGKVAYVPQQAWIQNTTLKQNIIFGKKEDKEKYDNIIEACALAADLQVLPGGDQTEIGEKGINLSGGQKQRVSLGRAAYSEADVYLFDDPLSAVDAHVGKHIFDNVIGPSGNLKTTTRVLVTHGIIFLPQVDNIIVIKNGQIIEEGSYEELIKEGKEFSELIAEHCKSSSEDSEDLRSHTNSDTSLDSGKGSIVTKSAEKSTTIPKSIDTKSAATKLGVKLMEQEKVETGHVKMSVYGYYFKMVGIFGSLIILLGLIMFQLCMIGTNYWLSLWTDETFGNSSIPENRDLYLGVYGAIGFGQGMAIVILNIVIAITTLAASSAMHETMLYRVIRSPMSFFDTTPLGRTVNRFAKDVDVCDSLLPQNMKLFLSHLFSFLGTVIIILTIIPWFGLAVLPITIIFIVFLRVYVDTSRQLKRLESVSRSPIFSHFGETITGSVTIRAFGMEPSFIEQSEAKVDANQVCYYPSYIAKRWVAIRLYTLGNLITFGAAIFVVLEHANISPSQVGLVISYAANITSTLNMMVQQLSEVESNAVSIERIKEYSELEQEAPWRDFKSLEKPNWPHNGQILFDRFAMRYRKGLDLVVKNININIAGGQLVGVVGRTGAGKSSLISALFRLVEAASGSITIDNVDISTIGLHDLRGRITVIPQDPILFSGSLRFNLDPFDHHNDEEIWSSLERSSLKPFVEGLEKGLYHEVSEGGDNLSLGQKQLICLARALLRNTKVLVLDEATAAVDLDTDATIQSTIRKAAKERGATIITVAHRINTVIDYDRVIVLDHGEVKEIGSPTQLMLDDQSEFGKMAKQSGLSLNDIKKF